MSEKPEQEQPKEEEKPKAKKEEHAEAKKEATPEPKAKKEQATTPQAAAQGEGQPKRKKISRMKLEEVEAEIKSIKEKMGGFQSGFARHLLARRKELADSSK